MTLDEFSLTNPLKAFRYMNEMGNSGGRSPNADFKERGSSCYDVTEVWTQGRSIGYQLFLLYSI